MAYIFCSLSTQIDELSHQPNAQMNTLKIGQEIASASMVQRIFILTSVPADESLAKIKL